MPNLAKMLKEEITRLAGRGTKVSVAGLRVENAFVKVGISQHKRLVPKAEVNHRRVPRLRTIMPRLASPAK